jgi:hypothetical protein
MTISRGRNLVAGIAASVLAVGYEESRLDTREGEVK